MYAISDLLPIQMLVKIDDIVSFQPHHTSSDVTSCAQEIVTFITDFYNWEKPILPEEPGCADMAFEPERFEWEYNKWDCKEIADNHGKLLFMSMFKLWLENEDNICMIQDCKCQLAIDRG